MEANASDPMVCKPLALLKSTVVTVSQLSNARLAIFTTLAPITMVVAVPQHGALPLLLQVHVVELVYR